MNQAVRTDNVVDLPANFAASIKAQLPPQEEGRVEAREDWHAKEIAHCRKGLLLIQRQETEDLAGIAIERERLSAQEAAIRARASVDRLSFNRRLRASEAYLNAISGE